MSEVVADSSVFRERVRNIAVESSLMKSGIDPLMSRLFASRGIQKIEDIKTTLSDMLPYDSLMNVTKAAEILADCRTSQSRVCIVSDYDCDGATACATLLEAFSESGMNVGFLVPDREIHGYGLTESIVDDISKLSPRPEYIITVDAGISSHAGVARANQYGIKVIITDHHLPAATLPAAELIVNPNQPGDTFASKHIAGCGVAWYVATAYYVELCNRNIDPKFEPEQLLPYVALGTIADVVALDKNNRVLVSEGISLIRKQQCSPGIIALANVGKREFEILNLTTQDIGFQIGPRINAAGRLKNMTAGILCLTTKNNDLASQLAIELNQTNEERKTIQENMLLESEKLSIPENNDLSRKSIVVFCPSFHKGVVGIVAGKLKDSNYRPTFVLTEAKSGDLVGSGRSIPGFHLKHALDEVNVKNPGMLSKFGGHAMAAGLTINKGYLERFRTEFEKICEQQLTAEILTEKIEYDGALDSHYFSVEKIQELNNQIWGQGFLAPLFLNEIEVKEKKLLSDGKHLKISGLFNQKFVNVIAFSFGNMHDIIGDKVNIAFQPQINLFNGRSSIQLQANFFPDLKSNLIAANKLEQKNTQEVSNVNAIDKAELARDLNRSRVRKRRAILENSDYDLFGANESIAEPKNSTDIGGLLSRVHAVREASTGESSVITHERRIANRQKLIS